MSNSSKIDVKEQVEKAWKTAYDRIQPRNAEDMDRVVREAYDSLDKPNPLDPQAQVPQNPSAQQLQPPNPMQPGNTGSMNGGMQPPSVSQPPPAMKPFTSNQGGNPPPQQASVQAPPVTPQATQPLPPPQQVQPVPPIQGNVMGPKPTAQGAGTTGYPNYQKQQPLPPQQEDTSIDFKRVGDYSKEVDEEPEYKGMTKFEYAQKIIKDLKKKKIPDNDIIFTLVNRIFMDVETARKILDKTIKAKDAEVSDKTAQLPDKSMDGLPKEGEEALEEDNVYNHMKVITNNNFPYQNYQFDAMRDPFEWELNSTQLVARALILDQRYEFETRFEIVRSNMARWPRYYDVLKDNNIHEVLKISVNQLNANSNYMHLTPDSTAIAPASESHVIKTMGQVFKSYMKLWGKSHFQVIIIGTESNNRITFNKNLAKELCKNGNIKEDDQLAVNVMNNFAGNNTRMSNKPRFLIVLKNSSGHKINEAGEDVIGSATIPAQPFEANLMGQTGEAIGAEQQIAVNKQLSGNLDIDDYEALMVEATEFFSGMSEQEIEVYRHYLDEMVRHKEGADPFDKGEQGFTPPNKTRIAYKRVEVRKSHPNKIFSLMVNSSHPYPVGEWIVAENLGDKAKQQGLTDRPGWHSVAIPVLSQFKRDNGAWFEVEIPADQNWQDIADQPQYLYKGGKKAGKTKGIKDIPLNGYYSIPKEPNLGDEWFISGAIKFNRVISEDEAEVIAASKGVYPDLQESYLDEITSSGGSGFMTNAPENVAHGGVVTNLNTPHKKPIPWGGENGEELKQGSIESLRKMGIPGY